MRYDDDDRRRVHVTMSVRANLGNYQHADVSMCLSGIEVGASEDRIDEMLDTAKLAYERMKPRLMEKVREQQREKLTDG